ncbi:hypothetical protein CSPX01_12677 [Colletotrichum filicis]|nr:hypothetical protein CSPX01_12677 [Colletotrichum filicis]
MQYLVWAVPIGLVSPCACLAPPPGLPTRG